MDQERYYTEPQRGELYRCTTKQIQLQYEFAMYGECICEQLLEEQPDEITQQLEQFEQTYYYLLHGSTDDEKGNRGLDILPEAQ
eukprot:2803727-Amphidinium_carterae.1